MKIFSVVALLLCMSVTAHALSDKDYEQFMKSSPAFSQSEARMNSSWKRLKTALSKEQYTELLAEQRAWLKERDMLAEKRLQKNGGTMVDAYTAENHKRAEELEARIPSPLGNGTSILQTAVPAPSVPVPSVPLSGAAPAGPTGPIVSPTPVPAAPAPVPSLVVPSPVAPKADAALKANDKPKPPVVTTPATPSPTQPTAPRSADPNPPTSPVSPGTPVPPSSAGSRNNTAPAHMVIGTYRNEFGSVMITNTTTGYTFDLNTASPDGNWVCSAAGQGRLEGDVFTFALPDGTEPQMLKVKLSGKTLSISGQMNDGLNLTYFCGNGGTLEGRYTKR